MYGVRGARDLPGTLPMVSRLGDERTMTKDELRKDPETRRKLSAALALEKSLESPVPAHLRMQPDIRKLLEELDAEDVGHDVLVRGIRDEVRAITERELARLRESGELKELVAVAVAEVLAETARAATERPTR